MTNKMGYKLTKIDGKWDWIATFGKCDYDNVAAAQTECNRRNTTLTPTVKVGLTDDQIDKLNENSLERGSGIVLPTIRNADRIFARLARIQEQEQQDESED